VRETLSDNQRYLQGCKICSLKNLCYWCPATAYLEHGVLDEPVDYFCEIAHARAQLLESARPKK